MGENMPMFPNEPEDAKGKSLMKDKDLVFFSKLEGSNNMTKSFPAVPDKKGERHAAQVIMKKTHTKYTNKLRLTTEIRLNLVLKYLIINIYKSEDEDITQSSRRKREKQPKGVAKDEAVKGIEEDQTRWLDMLKEEIKNLK
jgi:hypothetical protein